MIGLRSYRRLTTSYINRRLCRRRKCSQLRRFTTIRYWRICAACAGGLPGSAYASLRARRQRSEIRPSNRARGVWRSRASRIARRSATGTYSSSSLSNCAVIMAGGQRDGTDVYTLPGEPDGKRSCGFLPAAVHIGRIDLTPCGGKVVVLLCIRAARAARFVISFLRWQAARRESELDKVASSIASGHGAETLGHGYKDVGDDSFKDLHAEPDRIAGTRASSCSRSFSISPLIWQQIPSHLHHSFAKHMDRDAWTGEADPLSLSLAALMIVRDAIARTGEFAGGEA